MNVMRSPPRSLSTNNASLRALPSTPGTPSKRMRTTDDDIPDQMNTKAEIEELITDSIKKEFKKISETLRETLLETIQSGIRQTLDDSLKGLQIDLETCKTHHENIKGVQTKQKELEYKCNLLERENCDLKDRLNKLELYSRRNNVKGFGFQESPGEDCKKMILNFLRSSGVDIQSTDIVTAHRIHSTYKPRPILVQLTNNEIKKGLFQHAGDMKVNHNITFMDDLPQEVATARKILVPIMQYSKRISSPSRRYRSRVLDDKLIINSITYTIDTLHQLPSDLLPVNVFTREKGNMIGFYSKYSPLSNHHPCTFTIEGKRYNSVEQYYMHAKALAFEDLAQATKILESTNPVEQKHLGSRIKGFDLKVWTEKNGIYHV